MMTGTSGRAALALGNSSSPLIPGHVDVGEDQDERPVACIVNALKCQGGGLGKIHGEPTGAKIMPEVLAIIFDFKSGKHPFGRWQQCAGALCCVKTLLDFFWCWFSENPNPFGAGAIKAKGLLAVTTELEEIIRRKLIYNQYSN
jgi:hypothetical protein